MSMKKKCVTMEVAEAKNPFFLTENEKQYFFGVPAFEKEPYPDIQEFFDLDQDAPQYEWKESGDHISHQASNSSSDSRLECLNQFVISDKGLKAKAKNFWDVYMIVLIIYVSAVTSYRVCFGIDKKVLEQYQTVLDIIVESCFGMDMILSFFTGYLDPDTNKFEARFVRIAKRYLKSWFVVDFLSITPWEEMSNFDLQLFKLLRIIRLIRMVRLFKLLNEDMVNTLAQRLLQNLSMENKILVSYIIKYVFKIFRLLLLGIGLTYSLACLWYLFVSNLEQTNRPSFYKLINQPGSTDLEKLILCCYFILSTLTTVGYGDYVPSNDAEKLVAIFLMIIGITFFSYVLNSFTEIVTTYDKKMGAVDKSTELQVWVQMLQKFSEKPLQKSTIDHIYSHIGHFWKNDRLAGATQDDKYYQLMPEDLKKEFIYTLFRDIFFQKFKSFFLNRGLEYPEFQFYEEFAFNLIPRKYDAQQIIISQGESFQEMYFIMEGEVYIILEYRGLKIERYFSEGFYIGDFNILFDKPCVFTIVSNKETQVFSISKENFLKTLAMDDYIQQQIKIKSLKNHKDQQKVLTKDIKQRVEERELQIISDTEIERNIFNEKNQGQEDIGLKAHLNDDSVFCILQEFKEINDLLEEMKGQLQQLDVMEQKA